MTADDFVTKLIGSLVAALVAVVGWVVKTVVGNDKELARLKDKVRDQEGKVEKLERTAVGPEDIRKVMRSELEEHEKAKEALEKVREKTRRLETKELIKEVVEELAPRIYREMKADSGQFRFPGRHTPHKHDSKQDGGSPD